MTMAGPVDRDQMKLVGQHHEQSVKAGGIILPAMQKQQNRLLITWVRQRR